MRIGLTGITTCLLIITLCVGCVSEAGNGQEVTKISDPVIIHVPQANNRFGSLDDFFAEPSYIPLQTTPESLIGSINRLYFFDGRIYVLDKKQNAVLIFDQSGAFLSKVQRLGRGPGEYQSVMDFTIDRKQKHLLLYADRPYKLLTFEMDGTFLEETRVVGLFFNIAMANDRVQVFRKTDKELVSELDHGAVYRTLIPFDAVDLYFRDFFIPYPSLTTDKKVNILPPYSDTVYTYTGDSLAVSYVLDFGERRRQLGKEIERKTSYQDVYTKAMEEDLGFPVFGFRESDRFVSFTFGLNNIVIYDKTSKEAYTTKVFRKEGNPIWFKDYFAHDGEGDFLVSICQPTDFKQQVEEYLKKEGDEGMIPAEVSGVASGISETDNPVLVVYTFK